MSQHPDNGIPGLIWVIDLGQRDLIVIGNAPGSRVR